MSLRVAPYNNQEILIADKVDNKGNPISETHYCWAIQLTISGPTALTVGTPGTYTVTAKDYQGNALSTFADTITIQTVDANGDKQTISVTLSAGTGTFQFSSAAAGTFTLAGTGQTVGNTPYDSLPTGGLKVVVS